MIDVEKYSKRYLPLESDVPFLDALHIEANGRDGAMAKYQRMDQAAWNLRLREGNGMATLTKQVAAALALCRCAQHEARSDVLNRELSALEAVSRNAFVDETWAW